MIERAIKHILKASAEITTIVTGGIHLGAAPQDERRPRIVLTTIDHRPEYIHEGPAGYAQGRIQLDCFAPTYLTAKTLAALVKSTLDAADLSAAIVVDSDSTTIDYIQTGQLRDIPSLALPGQSLPLFGVSLDVMFQIEE